MAGERTRRTVDRKELERLRQWAYDPDSSEDTWAYITALETENLSLTGKVAYLEGKVTRYEDALLRPEPQREEPLVQLGDGDGQGVAAAGDQRALLVREDLHDTGSGGAARGEDVHVEPEALHE